MRTARPSVGLIVFGIVAILGVVGGIVLLVIYVVGRVAEANAVADKPPPPPPPVKAEVRDLQRGSDRLGGLFFVGNVVDTGTAPIGAVTAKLVLYDAHHAPVATALCTPPLGFLASGEKVPCAFSFGVMHAAFTTFEGSADAQPMSAQVKPVRLSITSGKMAQLGTSWMIDGTLHNDAPVPARTIVVFASIASADGRMVGAGSVALGGVAANASAPFKITIPDAIAPAKTFGLRVVGAE